MTKGTRIFRITVSILLAVTILWVAFLTAAFYFANETQNSRVTNERFGLYVAGIPVIFDNAADILGDGTVVYNKAANTLILNNASIEYDGPAIYSQIDVRIELIGENRIVSACGDTSIAIYASDNMLRKDIVFTGDGSLSITAGDGTGQHCTGIVADDLWVGADVSVAVSDAAETAAGIECAYLGVISAPTLTVEVGDAPESTGIFIRGDMAVEKDGTVKVTGAPASEGSYGIQCTGTVTAGEGATIDAVSNSSRAGIVCYGAVVDYGAAILAEIDALCGLRPEASG